MSDEIASSDNLPEDSESPQDISIPPELSREQLQYIGQPVHIERLFSGPLPPANELAKYEKDVRKVIVDMAIEQQQHRMTMEDRLQRLFFRRDMFAFILALIMIIGFIIVILSGYSIEGLLGIGGTVALVIRAFLYNDRKERDSPPSKLTDDEDEAAG